MSSLPPPPAGGGGADLLSRIVISLVACSLVTWQLAETANFKPDAAGAWLEKKPLQWYLVLLMLISALDGAVGVALEVARYTTNPEGNVVDLAAVVQGVGLQLFLGKVSQMILSLMIIGLGVSAWSQSAGRQPMKAYSMGATALGLASLFVRDLPPPLVLVAGISCLQRTPKAAQKEERAGGVFSGCFSLRCALRPLLLLACIEAVYASFTVDDDFKVRMEHSKHVAHEIVEAAAHSAQGLSAEEQAAADAAVFNMLMVYDAMRPEMMLEIAQQQLGELVQFGTVVALGFSGRANGLKHTLWPVAAASVPGLPTSFAVVFYFLLETRQMQGGGTLLPFRSPEASS